MTPDGIEPVTFQFVAQHLNHRATAVPYSPNIGIEYFKQGTHSPFFPLQNAVCFIILTYLVPVVFTFYTGCAKIKKNNSGAKRLRIHTTARLTNPHGNNSPIIQPTAYPV